MVIYLCLLRLGDHLYFEILIGDEL